MRSPRPARCCGARRRRAASTRSMSRATAGSGTARLHSVVAKKEPRQHGPEARQAASPEHEVLVPLRRQARQAQRCRHLQDRAEAEAERHHQVRLERRSGLQPRARQDHAVLEQRRGAGPHEGGAQPLQRDARRHDLLGQRGARAAQPDRAEREAEVGQVQGQPGQQEPPGAAPLGGLLLALGRPRVRERLLAGRELLRQQRERERSHALQPRPEGVPRLRAGELEQAQRPLPDRSLGPQPRGLLPRPALVPERERGREPRLRQPADGQPRRGARPRRRPRATCSRS